MRIIMPRDKQFRQLPPIRNPREAMVQDICDRFWAARVVRKHGRVKMTSVHIDRRAAFARVRVKRGC
jgi:hypothetical protein